MTYEEFNQYCGSFAATTYVMQWRGSHVWKVGGKVFAIGGWGEADKPAFSFKTSEDNYHFLEQKPGYKPAPYLASRGMKWIQAYDAPESDTDAFKYYLSESYRIVSLGLTKKKQRQLGLNQRKVDGTD